MNNVYTRLLALIALVVVTAGLVIVPVGSPAEANLSPYRWRRGTICVEDHIHDGRWPGKSATYRWSHVPDLKFVYRKDCDNYRNVIKLRSRYEGRNGRYGSARWWYNDNNRITRATVIMNDSYYGRGKMRYWKGRRAGIMHELGHVSGLRHTGRSKSVMNIYNFYKFNYPTWYDKREVERRYPW